VKDLLLVLCKGETSWFTGLPVFFRNCSWRKLCWTLWSLSYV